MNSHQRRLAHRKFARAWCRGVTPGAYRQWVFGEFSSMRINAPWSVRCKVTGNPKEFLRRWVGATNRYRVGSSDAGCLYISAIDIVTNEDGSYDAELRLHWTPVRCRPDAGDTLKIQDFRELELGLV